MSTRTDPLFPYTALFRSGRLGQHLVVDVRDVPDQGDLQAAPGEPAPEHVERDSGAQMADVRGCLHRGATQVDADLARGDGGEVAHLARGGVKRSEETTSERQSLMRISYAVFCSKTK